MLVRNFCCGLHHSVTRTLNNAHFFDWYANRYDVPPAPAGTPPAEAVHTLTTRFTTRDLMNLYSHPGCDPFTEPYCADTDKAPNGVRLIMAGGHCHAPACLDITLFNNDTGEMLCRVTPTLGQVGLPDGLMSNEPCVWNSRQLGFSENIHDCLACAAGRHSDGRGWILVVTPLRVGFS